METIYESALVNGVLYVIATIFDEQGNIFHTWIANKIKCV